MGKNFSFLNEIAHRPWEKPNKSWQYYQEWNDVLFLHFEVDYNKLRLLVPDDLDLDSFNGKYYISVVPFKMEHIRPAYLPAVGFISNFLEVNVRTYVKKNGKTGVYFINIEASKKLSCFLAKKLSGLPYHKGEIARDKKSYVHLNRTNDCYLDVAFEIDDKAKQKSEFDLWLTERYSLFLEKNKKLYIYEIHHKEWEIRDVNILHLDIQYRFKKLSIESYQLISSHYSPGVQVVSWNSKEVK